MEERNTNFYINDGLIMQGKQIDTSVAVKIALDHGWSSIKGEHIFMETLVSPVDYTPLTNSGLLEYRGKKYIIGQPVATGRETGNQRFSSAIILSMRFWWRPPSNSAFRKASTIWQARPAPTTRPPRHRALASLWRRVYSALKESLQQQARMPWILLADMEMPTPVPQNSSAFSHWPFTTASQAGTAMSG